MNADPGTLATSRVLPYTADAIYEAFASPETLASWWGPEGFTNSFETFEFAPGGRWTFVMHGPDGRDYPNESVFETLEPGARVVIRHVVAPLFTVTVRLAPAGGGTRLDWEQRFDDAGTAEAVARIVGRANEQNLDRLERALARTRA